MFNTPVGVEAEPDNPALTPSFKLSLAWSAISDTAATAAEKERKTFLIIILLLPNERNAQPIHTCKSLRSAFPIKKDKISQESGHVDKPGTNLLPSQK